MELVISVFLLIVLAVLAACFGCDSRDGIQSKEAELARMGVQWPGGRPIPLVRPVQRHRRIRRFVARRLLALAEWLSPGLPAARMS